MKIVLATESFPPVISGVAVSTYQLAKSLIRAGHEVWVFAPARQFRDHDETDAEASHLHICRVKSVRNPFRADHRVSFIPKRRIHRLMSEIKPDLVHLQDPNGVSTATFKEAKRLGVPIVITNHFTPELVLAYLRWPAPMKRLARRQLVKHLRSFYNRCDMVLTPTQTVADMLASWGVDRPIQAVSNGVTLERFTGPTNRDEILKRYHIPTDKPLVLYVGRIDPDKSIEVLMRAIPKILAKTPAHFVLIGKGGAVKQCRAIAERLGVAPSVTFTGALHPDSADLPQLYRHADLFVIPSEIETQSIVTLEAMAAGLPIAAAKAGALTELVGHGENGFLFEPGNPDHLANAVIAILEHPDPASLGAASKAKVKPHAMRHSHEQIASIYQSVHS